MELLAALGALVAVAFNAYCIWRWFDHIARVERASVEMARRIDRLTEIVEQASKQTSADLQALKKSIDGGE